MGKVKVPWKEGIVIPCYYAVGFSQLPHATTWLPTAELSSQAVVSCAV